MQIRIVWNESRGRARRLRRESTNDGQMTMYQSTVGAKGTGRDEMRRPPKEGQSLPNRLDDVSMC